HGILPCRSDRDFVAALLIVLAEGAWRKRCPYRAIHRTRLQSSGRAAARARAECCRDPQAVRRQLSERERAPVGSAGDPSASSTCSAAQPSRAPAVARNQVRTGLVWGFFCQAVVLGLLSVLCSEREGGSSSRRLAIRFAERAEGVKGPKC